MNKTATTQSASPGAENTRRQKSAIVVAHVDEQRGMRGGEQQAAWLVNGLAALGVTNILVRRQGEAFVNMETPGFGPLRLALPLRGELDLYSAWRLARFVNRHGVDILHAHASHAHGLAVLAKQFGARCRVVVSRRVNFMPGKHLLNRWKYRQADRILCVSEKVAETLGEYGLGPPQVCVAHSAVDPGRAMMPPAARSALGVPESAPLLVSAGSLVDHKDHANLLEAAALVRSHIPDIQVCIAGEGPLRAALEAKREALGLVSCVHFLGYRTDAPAITRAADVYVSSSWSEGLGTSILEALAAGVPVVAAEAGGAREMVIPGETGFLTPVREPQALAKAIIESLRDRDRARRMAETGQRYVLEHFSVTRMVTRTLAAYNELLGHS